MRVERRGRVELVRGTGDGWREGRWREGSNRMERRERWNT